MASTKAESLGLFYTIGLALLIAATPATAAAEVRGEDGKASETKPVPEAGSSKPAKLPLEKIFPTLREVADHTPPALRSMSGTEETEYRRLITLSAQLSDAGQWQDKLPVDLRILALEEATFGPAHPEVAGTLGSIGYTCYMLGRFAEAEAFDRRALAVRIAALGEDHPEVFSAMDALGRDLDAQPIGDATIHHYQHLLERSIAVLGEANEQTIGYHSRLAGALRARGRDVEAAPIQRRALELARGALGEEDPATLFAMSKVALDMRTLGRFAEAEALDRQVLSWRMRTYGETDDRTISSLGSLAEDLLGLGQYTEAEPLFRRALAIKRQTSGDAALGTLRAMNALGSNLSAQGRYAEAEAIDRQALDLWTEHFGERHLHALGSLSYLARDLRGLGRYAEAEGLERRALVLKLEALGESAPSTLESLSRLADDLVGLGRHAEAEVLHRRAVDLNTREWGESHPDTLAARLSLAANLRDQGEEGQAETLDRQTLLLFTQTLGERHPATLGAISALAWDLRAQKRYREAEDLDRRALAISTELLGEGHLNTLNALGDVALDLYRQKDFAGAEALYLKVWRKTGEILGAEHPTTLDRAFDLAMSLLQQPGRESEALAPARASLNGAWARYIRQQSGNLRENAQAASDRVSLQAYQRLFADAAWLAQAKAGGAVDAIEAFAALQGASAGPASRAIAEVAARRYAAGAGVADLVAERNALDGQWSALDRRVTSALSGGTALNADRARMAAQQSAFESRIVALDAQIAAKAPQYAAIINQPALTVPGAQALLNVDEAVLMVVPSAFGTQVMVITREGLQWHRAEMDVKTVGAAVSHLRAQLDPSGLARSTTLGTAKTVGAYRYDRTAAWELYQALVAPVAGGLAGKRHVYVAADGALASLPFGVLVTQKPQEGTDDTDPAVLRDTRWLSDEYALVQIPSLQSLAWLRNYTVGAMRSAGSGFAGFGDPLLGGQSVMRGSRGAALPVADATSLTGSGASDAGAPLMDPSALRRLSRLPGTKAELEAMRATLGAPAGSLHMGAAMTEGAIRTADLSRTSILHLATHGLTASESGARAEPGLVFTPPIQASNEDDGYLAASEVLALDLTSTEWVILSACNTAAPSGNPGEAGLSGLARAFFYAGAPSLLASHWPVDDAVAAQLTVETLRRAKETGTSKAQALQAAMRSIRNDTAHPEWAHPSAWAPFTLVGEGRKSLKK